MKNLKILILVFFVTNSFLFSEVREHFLIGWIGGKSFVGERGHTIDQADLGFYQGFYLQFSLSKKFAIQIELSEQIHKNFFWKYGGGVVKTEGKEGYAFFSLVYKLREIRPSLTPYFFLSGGSWGSGIYSLSAALKSGTGLKYSIFAFSKDKIVFYLNLNIGLFYMWLDENEPLRESLTLFFGMEFGI
jgi:hypothetical protein